MNDRYAGRSTYVLASKWLALVRSEARWEPAHSLSRAFARPLGWAVGKVSDWKSRRREAIADELIPRFVNVVEQALLAAGCAPENIRSEVVMCVLRLCDRVNAELSNRCLPELLWLAVEDFGAIPEPARSRLHAKCHLRALLDELPSSDERGALREFVYGTTPGSMQDLAAAYSARRDEVKRGIDLFARYLHKERDDVERRTNGAISAESLLSFGDAQAYIVRNFRD